MSGELKFQKKKGEYKLIKNTHNLYTFT